MCCFDPRSNHGRAPLNSSLVAAIQGQLGLAREKERALGRAMAIPARKVFLVATPVVEVAAQAPRGRASSVLRRAYAALIPPLTLKGSITYRAAADNRYIVVRLRLMSNVCSDLIQMKPSVLRYLLDVRCHAIASMLGRTTTTAAGVLRGSDCTR